MWRVDGHSGMAALFLGCLALGVLAALLTAPARRGGSARPSRASVRASSLLSTGAFVATDFAERAVSGDYAVPPLLVLLIGAAVYALVGAGASLLWHRVAGVVPRVLAIFDDKRPVTLFETAPGDSRPVRRSVRHRTAAVAERAPPIGSV
ncbi:hypothetical protein [Glycomyces salinus]|uniref:hypothetical protein n=1 Tax=Glycomyces salinus TaxID=980294 RepID=UPI0018EBD1BE|nr:hypothetical protein [Glycomyces salinus]